ncbi:MAG: hypothetical protein ACI4KB_02665 [Oscillospiraceae bacterium]
MTEEKNPELTKDTELSEFCDYLTNRENKDRLFKFIFGNEKYKHVTLSLYNAISGRNYTNPEDIELNTIEDVLYMGMKNDISFLIGDMMNFYEHQSSFNPNMPMRMFVYAGMIYSKYIGKVTKRRIYSTVLQKFPLPKCFCFYNGESKKDDRIVLSLKDAFTDSDIMEPDIDVKVTMININYGHNKKLMDSCKPLNEYAWFVDRMRSYTKETGNPDKAADKAIDEMPDDWTIKSILLENRSEVKRMWLTEYNAEEHLETMKEDAMYFAMEEARKIVEEEMAGEIAEMRAQFKKEEERLKGESERIKGESERIKGESERFRNESERAEEQNIRSVKALMVKQNLSAEMAMDILDVPMDKREVYKKILL